MKNLLGSHDRGLVFRSITISVAAATLLLPSPALLAADAELEEIVVTGTKRDTSMQDTPLAVSTLTAGMLSDTFVNDIRAVADLTPNVLLTKQPGFNAVAGGNSTFPDVSGVSGVSSLDRDDEWSEV